MAETVIGVERRVMSRVLLEEIKRILP